MTASLRNTHAVSRSATRTKRTITKRSTVKRGTQTRRAPLRLVPAANDFSNDQFVSRWHAERVREATITDVRCRELPFEWTLDHDVAFPEVANLCELFGTRVLLQLRVPKRRTASGIILPIDSRDTENDITQVGVIRGIGPLAFCDRKTRRPWPEGVWAKPGDFVRCPKYGGDRWTVDIKVGDDNEKVTFAIFNDLDLIGRWHGDPLSMVAYV